jgi:hypothetical protein
LITDNNFGAATDENGNYVIKNLKPGTYTLSVTYIGFEKQTQKIDVYSGRTTEVNIVLKSTSFNIGGIEVVGTSEFIPLDPETKTEISSGEIEHMQAASLGDVLQLMPGVKTVNPTLNALSQAEIRGGDPLGTQVIMDGVPISNSANMQSSEDNFGYATGGSGVDLRSIPAENIGTVEIIRGVPSVKYGDFVDGTIIVKSKATPSPLRLKTKYNPRVYEANLSGGYRLSDNWIVNGNLNLASSDRNVKVEGDGYTRIVGQINTYYDTEDLELQNSFYVTRILDELTEQPGYASRKAWYNRDLTLKYIGDINYVFNSLSEVNATFSLNYTKRNSYQQRIISQDNMVVSDRTEEGAQEGKFLFGSYLGQEWLKGSEWNLYADINYETGLFTGEYLHKFLMGINWKDDFNKGEGYIFDPLRPISWAGYSTPRLRSFDDLPSFNTLSFYFEDKIAGRLFRPFTLQFGFRYEAYRPTGINLKGLWGDGDFIESNNGSFFNPRINFSYNLFESTQIRLGYGVTSKAPSMYTIFRQDEYKDIVDTNSVVDPTDPSANFAIVSTYIFKNRDEKLKGMKQYKYEASVDQKIGPVGFTLTGFINESKGIYTNDSKDKYYRDLSPTVLYKKSFHEWPNTDVYTTIDTLFTSIYKTNQSTNLTAKGIEFGFKTKKIPVINTILNFDASYMHKKYDDGSSFRYSSGSAIMELDVKALGGRIVPIYKPVQIETEELLFNFRFDIQAESLGMWITVHVQHHGFKKERYTEYDSLAIGYYTLKDELVIIHEEERSSSEYRILRDSNPSYELREETTPNITPNQWLVNLKVSKSLWEGAAISFFVNNLFNNKPLLRVDRSSPISPSYRRANPGLFYGMEFQTSL